MRFMIVDDDDAVRSMLADIIEDYDLGVIAAEASDGSAIDADLLAVKKIDILLIDMLMPVLDGVQIVHAIKDDFPGKIIMLSQVENKEMVGNAYALGVDYYITKPINRSEVVSVIQTASEHIRLKNLVQTIGSSVSNALQSDRKSAKNEVQDIPDQHQKLTSTGEMLLSELGVSGEKGCRDLLSILQFLFDYERAHHGMKETPCLKEIFRHIATSKLGPNNAVDIQKECKALEQRLRRTIFQALLNLASMGVIDYTNPKFEAYAAKFFDFTEVRKVMLCLKKSENAHMSKARINIKKFITVLFIESKK